MKRFFLIALIIGIVLTAGAFLFQTSNQNNFGGSGSAGITSSGIPCTPQISTTDSLTAVSGTGEQFFVTSCKIPANTLVAGKVVRATVIGELTSSSTPAALTVNVTLCQVSGCASGTKVQLYSTGSHAPAASLGFGFGGQFLIQSTAAAGAAVAIETGCVTCAAGVAGSNNAPFLGNGVGGRQTVATNVDEYFSLSLQYAATTAGNSMLIRQMIFEQLN